MNPGAALTGLLIGAHLLTGCASTKTINPPTPVSLCDAPARTLDWFLDQYRSDRSWDDVRNELESNGFTIRDGPNANRMDSSWVAFAEDGTIWGTPIDPDALLMFAIAKSTKGDSFNLMTIADCSGEEIVDRLSDSKYLLSYLDELSYDYELDLPQGVGPDTDSIPTTELWFAVGDDQAWFGVLHIGISDSMLFPTESGLVDIDRGDTVTLEFLDLDLLNDPEDPGSNEFLRMIDHLNIRDGFKP